jgi:hypothetical protein
MMGNVVQVLNKYTTEEEELQVSPLLREWRVESEEWRVKSGEWRGERGEGRGESGEWRVESGEGSGEWGVAWRGGG